MAIALASCADPRALSTACDGGACAATVHAPGILDPSSPNFHVNILRQTNWGFAQCATCHGADFTGGTSGVSYLRKMLDVVLFPELWQLRTEL